MYRGNGMRPEDFLGLVRDYGRACLDPDIAAEEVSRLMEIITTTYCTVWSQAQDSGDIAQLEAKMAKMLSDEAIYDVTYTADTAKGQDLRHMTVTVASRSHATYLATSRLRLDTVAGLIRGFKITRVVRRDLDDLLAHLSDRG